MEQFMQTERFTTDPESDSADKCWKHWQEIFTNFIEVLHSERPGHPINKHALLTNYLSHTVNEIISDYVTYEEAIDVLNTTYIKPKNEIFSRHLLATRRQESGKTLDHFLKNLWTLSKDCNFCPMKALEAQEQHILDAFINGFHNTQIRQHLLENKTLTLRTAYKQAYIFESAIQQSSSYLQPDTMGAVLN